MDTPITINKEQARRFLLAHQHLWPPRQLDGKGGVLKHIHHVGCIQFDPLNITGRSPELVLQARVADFRPEMLDELLYQDRKLLDGWDKVMSIYSVEDWPYFHRRRQAARQSERYHSVLPALPQVRQEIKARGPLSSIDLDMNETVDWSWAPTRLARAALESMYYTGELIIHHKVNTRKVYDFASRHIPAKLLDAPEPNQTEEHFHDWYVLRRIGGIGLIWSRSGDGWLGMPGIKSVQRLAALKRLLARGQVMEVNVDGLEAPLYMRSQDQAQLDEVLTTDAPPPGASILAPLDNLIWDRRFIKELFGFEYLWEVYKPIVERQ